MPVVLSLLACGPTPVPLCRDLPEYVDVATRLDLARQTTGVPGVQVAIVVGGELVCTDVSGQIAADDATPVTPSTRFAFGSITKSLTSATAVALQSRGELDLDAPIGDALSDFALEPTGDPERDDPGAITLRDTLSHYAGFADATNFRECPETPTIEALGSWRYRLDTPPGMAYHYGNQGYWAAGLAVERAGGDAYAEVVRRRLLDPDGMDGVSFDAAEIAAGDHASGFQDEVEPPGTFGCPIWAAAGGAWGTATDLGRFAEDLYDDGGALDAAEVAELFTPVGETRAWPGQSYGLGLFHDAHDGDAARELVSHDGRWNGFLTEMALIPDGEIAVIALSNSDVATPVYFAREQAAILAGWGPPLSGVDAPDPDEWSAYEGTWIYDGPYAGTGAFAELRVVRDRDWLYGSKDGGPDLPFTPVAGDAFSLPDDIQELDYDPVVFWRDEAGEVSWLVSRNWSAKRAP